MKKKLNLVKVLLLSLTLAVLSFSILPATDADPGDITILCDGTENICRTFETDDTIYIFLFGNETGIIIE